MILTIFRLDSRAMLAKRFLATQSAAAAGIQRKVAMSHFDSSAFINYSAIADRLAVVRRRFVAIS